MSITTAHGLEVFFAPSFSFSHAETYVCWQTAWYSLDFETHRTAVSLGAEFPVRIPALTRIKDRGPMNFMTILKFLGNRFDRTYAP